MPMENPERIGKALELLKRGLRPFVERELKSVHKDRWLETVNLTLVSAPSTSKASHDPNSWDAQVLLLLIWNNWHDVFRRSLSQAERTLVSELRNVRNQWAHQQPFNFDDTYRALDSAYRLLTAISSPEAAEVEKERQEILRTHFGDHEKREEKKTPADVHDRFSQRCPACGYIFKRWPWGWDAHAASKCPGLKGKTAEERKREYRTRFRHLFLSSDIHSGQDVVINDDHFPYDMGNAGDLVKHGLLAEFTQWWCEYEKRPLRFLDPFVGEPWVSSPNPEVSRRIQALPQCAIRDSQPDPVSRYYGSTFVVVHAAQASGSSAEVIISDAEPARVQAFQDLGFRCIACQGFSSINGYSILDVDIIADLVLLDPFSRFLPDHARDVIPKIAVSAKRMACIFFVLNRDPNNSVGRRYQNLRSTHLPMAWSLHCPKLADRGVRGESKYEVDVLLAWDSLQNHPARDALRERLQRYAACLSSALGAEVAFFDSDPDDF